MEESEIAQLCRKIYWQHKEALDLIYEHRPDLESEIFEIIKDLVGKPTLLQKVVINHSWASRKILGLAIPDWDTRPFQKTYHRWTPSNRILLFEFEFKQPNINFILTLGPGELSNRIAIFEALNNQDITGWTDDRPKKEQGWVVLMRRTVSESVIPDASISEISEEIRNFWHQFLEKDLPHINKAIVQNLPPISLNE